MNWNWTEEEISFIKNNLIEKLPLKEIAKRLGRTYAAVRAKSYSMGFIYFSKKIITDEEFLRAIAESKSYKEAAVKLGYKKGCSYYTVKSTQFSKLIHKLKPDISHFNISSQSIIKNSGYNKLITFYNRYNDSCKIRNKEFSLSQEQFDKLCLSNCYYCGGIGDTRIGKYDIYVCGIDRLDNSIGYLETNCVACCKKCNFMKHKMDKKEFVNQAIKIADYQRSLQSADTNQEIPAMKNPISSDSLSYEPNEHSLERSLSLDQYDQ